MFTFEYSKSTQYKSLSENFYEKVIAGKQNENLRGKFFDNGILGIDFGDLEDNILIEKFHDISNIFGYGVVRDAMRRDKFSHDDRNIRDVASVDPDYLHRPHSEASFSPAKPAVISFLCTDIEEKAIDLGKTTILDGKQIWKELDIQTKKCLLTSDITYELAVDIPQTSSKTKNIKREWYLDAVGVHNVEIDKGLGKMYLKYKTPFVTEHPLTRELTLANHAFINPITEPQITDLKINLSKNSKYSEKEVKNNVLNILENNIRTIKWKKGRCIFIDNYRFMHGRLPYNIKLIRKILIKQLKKFAIN